MKFAIAREHILQGLQAVQNIVGQRTPLPVLANVHLQAEEARLDLTATDLDVTISCSVPAKVKTPGATTIPVKKLFSICRELGNLEVEIEVDDRNVAALSSGGSFYRIHGLAAAEFPGRPEFAEARRVSVPQETLRAMLRKTSFAISVEESRYVLNGVCCSLRDHKMTLVATDGRRLALVEEEIELPAGSEGEFIIPTKAINELNRLLGPAGQVDMQFSDKLAWFSLVPAEAAPPVEPPPRILIITKLIEGVYPNYRQVIPGESRERVPLMREELLHALRRAEIMTSERSNSVKLAFTRNNLAITSNAPEVGEGRESLAINYKGPDIAVAFNPLYLMDPLKALDEEEVFLDLNDELSPGVVKTNGRFLYVIMPMRMT